MRIFATRLSDPIAARLFRPSRMPCMGGNPHEDAASGSARPYRSFGAFYPFYLSQHAERNCRRLHFLGTTLALAGVITAVMTRNLWWLAAALMVGYGLAWLGHFFFEKNRPAT